MKYDYPDSLSFKAFFNKGLKSIVFLDFTKTIKFYCYWKLNIEVDLFFLNPIKSTYWLGRWDGTIVSRSLHNQATQGRTSLTKPIFNGMLCHALGGAVILFSLQHFIALAFDLLPCLQAWGTRDCNKGSKFKKKAMKCSK